MKKIIWEKDAFEEWNTWEKENPRIFKKITDLIFDIQKQPFKWIGKPEPLKYQLKGCWFRRINSKHRLVYRITSSDEIYIIGCKGHYD